MPQTENRNKTIQIMRGIAIILVLIQHAIVQVNTDYFLIDCNTIIFCFHVPTFLIIAGFLFQKGLPKYVQKGKAEFLAGKAKHLLLPYVFWTVLLWAVIQLVCALGPEALVAKMTELEFTPMNVGELLFGLLTYQVHYTEHLWFLYILFVLFVINIFAHKNGGSLPALIIWAVIGLSVVFFELPYIVEKFAFYGIFFTLGRFIRVLNEGKKIRIEKESAGLAFGMIVCAVFAASSFMLLSGLSLGIEARPFSILLFFDTYLVGFSGAGVVYIAAKLGDGGFCSTKAPQIHSQPEDISGAVVWDGGFCSTKAPQIHSQPEDISGALVEQNPPSPMKCLGDYSYDIYLMHNPYFVALGANVLSRMLGVNPYLSIGIATAIGIFIPMAVSRYILRKNKVLSLICLGR